MRFGAPSPASPLGEAPTVFNPDAPLLPASPAHMGPRTETLPYAKSGLPHLEREWTPTGQLGRLSVYRPTGFKLADYHYRPTGGLQRIVSYDTYGSPLDITHLQDDGRTRASVTRMGYGGLVQHRTDFQRDGQTPQARTEYGLTGDVTNYLYDGSGRTIYIRQQHNGHGQYMRLNPGTGLPLELGKIVETQDQQPQLSFPSTFSPPPLPTVQLGRWLNVAGAAAAVTTLFSSLTSLAPPTDSMASAPAPVKVSQAFRPR